VRVKACCGFSVGTFTDVPGGDRVGEMAEYATPSPRSHPLLEDRARLEKIKNNMHIQIQLVLHGRRIGDDVELVLPGGASVDDVLQDALIALLRTDSKKLRSSWESLSYEIARNKAKDALSKATNGRRRRTAEPGTPDDVKLVTLEDIDRVDTDLGNDPEAAFVVAEQHRVLLRLARETLTQRERLIFHTGYYKTMTDKELGEQLGGITSQGVGEQRRRILRNLYETARRDPSFPTLNVSDEGS
jgi:RNA polymerase sigma factor (sigma-70 family)